MCGSLFVRLPVSVTVSEAVMGQFVRTVYGDIIIGIINCRRVERLFPLSAPKRDSRVATYSLLTWKWQYMYFFNELYGYDEPDNYTWFS